MDENRCLSSCVALEELHKTDAAVETVKVEEYDLIKAERWDSCFNLEATVG